MEISRSMFCFNYCHAFTLQNNHILNIRSVNYQHYEWTDKGYLILKNNGQTKCMVR